MFESRSRGMFVRVAVLSPLLGLMLLALAYDYKVARPKVTAAEAIVAKLNTEMNASPDHRTMTNKDVQNALNRPPSRTFAEGSYQVEQYSWISGLLFRSHSYYALYRPVAGKLCFQMHFSYRLPPDIGSPPRVEKSGDMGVDDLPGDPAGLSAGGGGFGKSKPRWEGDEAGSETPETEREAAEDSAPESPPEGQEAPMQEAAPEKPTPEPPEALKPATEPAAKPAAEEPAAEKPGADKPEAERPA